MPPRLSLDSSLLPWYTIAPLTWEEAAEAHQTTDWIQASQGTAWIHSSSSSLLKHNLWTFVFVPKPPRQIL